MLDASTRSRFRWIAWTFAAAFAFDGVAAVEPAPVNLMSFNLRNGRAKDGDNAWPKRRDFVAETIRAARPDVLGTQECFDFQAEFLAGQLPEFARFGRGRRADGGDERCEVFWRTSRFERVESGDFMLSPTPDVHGSKGWDAALPRIATWVRLRDRRGGAELLVVNTHFDHRGARAREESAKLVRDRAGELAGDDPLIVMGDFNFGTDKPGYRTLAATPWIDTYRAAHPEPTANEGTFSGFVNRKSGARIDFIFTRGWTVEAAAIDHTARDGRNPSDHFPVTARISRKPIAPDAK